MAPFGRLTYLYVGTSDLEHDLAYYTQVLGAKLLWNYHEFGARVASVRLSEGPQYILADHRHAPSVLPIFEVGNLKAAAKDFRSRGWKPEGRSFEIPPGPCFLFKDPSGNELAMFEDVRPELMETSFGDPDYPPTGHAEPAKRTVAHPNAALVERLYSAFESNDREALTRLIATEAVWHVPGATLTSGDHRGRAAIFAYFRKLAELTNGTFRADLVDVLASDTHAAAFATAKASRGNRTYAGSYLLLVRIEDDRIVEARLFNDEPASFEAFWS